MSNPVPASLALTSIAPSADILSADHRTNYAAIQAAVNEIITALSGGTAGDVLTAAGASAVQWGSGVPTGALLEYGAAAAPTGWLLCDGSAVSRSTYAALFAIIGTTYGTGDGSTTFNLPDLRGRVAVGYAAAGGHADVSTLGANDGQAVANRRPKHRTSLTDPGHSHSIAGGGGSGSSTFTGASGGGVTTATNSAATGITVGSGNANDALDAPSYVVVNRIIKS